MKAAVRKFIAIAGLAAGFILPAAAETITYQIDPRHSSANFTVTHLLISKVPGEFHGVTGTIVVDNSDITKSSVNVTIDANTVNTNEPDRDKDLKSPNFFDVARYPTITFKSTKVEKNADGTLKIAGDLTIHGVTRSVVLNATAPKPPIKDPWGLTRTGSSASTMIDRKDYGITWDKTLDGGGAIVSDEVNITLNVEMVVPPAK
ncbi:MAG TPA: YceI family protein [Candidatus Eisenbacteria bacterium]|nr:YceI family protein [Candidatus Eisenbacteria bacterium]